MLFEMEITNKHNKTNISILQMVEIRTKQCVIISISCAITK